MQEAAYSTLPANKRRKLHSLVAQAIEDTFPDIATTQPGIVAHHLAQAGMAEQAIGYLRVAAQRAIEQSANAEAIGCLTSATKLLESLGESQTRDQAALALGAMRAQAMIAMHGYAAPQTREALLRAKALIRDRVDSIEGLAILYGSWAASYVGGDSKEQKLAASELLAEAERQGNSGALCMAHRAMGTTLLNRGDFGPSLRHLSQAQELYNPDQHSALRHKYGQDIGTAALCYLSWALWHLGDHQRAEATASEAVRRANELSHPHSIVYATAHARGFMDIFSRRTDNLQSSANLIITLSMEQNFSHWINCGRILHGWAAVCRNEFDKGIDEILSGIAGWQGTGSRLWLPMFWTLAAEAFAKSGHPRNAAQAIDQALIASRETGETWALAEILRVKAQICEVLDTANNDVEGLLRSSLEIARGQSARSIELRVACDLARHCEKRSRRIEALSLARRPFNKFTGEHF